MAGRHDADSNGAQPVPQMIFPGKADSWYSKKRSTLGAAAVLTALGTRCFLWDRNFFLAAISIRVSR